MPAYTTHLSLTNLADLSQAHECEPAYERRGAGIVRSYYKRTERDTLIVENNSPLHYKGEALEETSLIASYPSLPTHASKGIIP